MTETPAALLDRWRQLLGKARGDLQAELGFSDSVVREGVNYIGLTGLTQIYDDDLHPGQFYLRDGRLALIYIEDPADTYSQISPQALAAELGQPAEVLPSRAGRNRRQYIYPERGVAYAADDDEVAFVEIFAPMSLERYRAELYMAPKKFIR